MNCPNCGNLLPPPPAEGPEVVRCGLCRQQWVPHGSGWVPVPEGPKMPAGFVRRFALLVIGALLVGGFAVGFVLAIAWWTFQLLTP